MANPFTSLTIRCQRCGAKTDVLVQPCGMHQIPRTWYVGPEYDGNPTFACSDKCVRRLNEEADVVEEEQIAADDYGN